MDATRAPWSQNYRMHAYVTGELIALCTAELPVRAGVQSVSGHSMGGHGALVCALRNPGLYRSASAFAPIANPMEGAWGQRALTGYLGADDREAWRRWDATELVRQAAMDGDVAPANALHLLVDQGGADNFLAAGQLLPGNLVAACKESGVALEYAEHEGYDHGYYFVASFVEKHLVHHRRFLE